MAYSNWSPGQYIYLKAKITNIVQSSAVNNFLIRSESTYSFQCCGSCFFLGLVCAVTISVSSHLHQSRSSWKMHFPCSHAYNGFTFFLPLLPHRSLCHKVNDLIKMSHLGKCSHSLQIVYLWIFFIYLFVCFYII